MKKITVIFIGLLLIVLALTLKDSFSVNINSKSTTNPASPDANRGEPTQNSDSSLKSRENNEGSVAITVTPLNLKDNSSTWNFEIVLDTHSGSLDADLVAVSKLLDDQGKLYKPTSWEGDNPGGHHRKGILKFSSISPKPKFLELKIKNIGGVSERSFKWSL